jgi:hypothetical protein
MDSSLGNRENTGMGSDQLQKDGFQTRAQSYDLDAFIAADIDDRNYGEIVP